MVGWFSMGTFNDPWLSNVQNPSVIPRGEGGNELAIFSFCSGKVARPSTTTSFCPRFVLLFFRGQGPSMIFLGMCSESNQFYKMFVIMYLYIYKYREREADY